MHTNSLNVGVHNTVGVIDRAAATVIVDLINSRLLIMLEPIVFE
jgi:hypothetical protein